MESHASLRQFIADDAQLSALLVTVSSRLVDDPGHDAAHCMRVALWTVRLGGGEVHPRHAVAAALLHDIVNLPKDSPDRARASELAAEAARKLLRQHGFAAEEITLIADAIHDHGYSTGRVPRTPLGEALQDADRLEALGALGILRAATCGARLRATYFDTDDPWAERRALDDKAHTIDHFFTKLLTLASTLRTGRARSEALRRAEYMAGFLRELGLEIGAPPPESRLEVGSGIPAGARDQARVYESDPEGYERLVAAEDWCGNLIPALERIVPLDGARVLEVGVGTGRIARQLLARGANVTGFDRADPMLAVARSKLAEVSTSGWELANADARRLPVPSRSFDLAVAGWVFGHLRHWLPDDWRASIGEALDEMRRALKPGGKLVVIETLGTGTTEPAPPSLDLAEYYQWLESEQGMTRTSIRTDYDFPTVDAAVEATAAFFGAAFAERVRTGGWARIPECTGIWWQTVDRAIPPASAGR